MKKLIIIPVLILLLFPGCRSTQPVQNNFFLLELPSAFFEDSERRVKSLDATCELKKVEVAAPYASHQIAIREDSHRMRYFTFNEWAHRPGQSFSNMALRYLEEGKFFRELFTGRQRETPDYLIETKVFHLEVDNRTGMFEARLVVEFQMINTASNEPVVLHPANKSRFLQDNGLNLFAAATSDLFYDELSNFMELVIINFDD